MAVLALTRLTFVDTMRQPVTWLLTGLSLALVILSYAFGMFNFETEDRIRMLATAGTAAALINGLFLAVVATSQQVHDELASRTALTLFAKPLGRGQFLVGKVLGVWLAVVFTGAIIAGVHLLVMTWAAHTGFDDYRPKDSPFFDPEIVVPWQPIILAHLFALGHSACLGVISATLALRLGLVANILTCFAIFVVGHLLSGAHIPGAVVIPGLALFNLDDAIQLVTPVPTAYVAMTVLYTALFCAGWLMLGLALFKHQDIP
jgi:hypothetical protein